MHHPTDRITHTTAFVTPVVEHWLKREIAQWVHPMKDRSDDPSHHEQTLLPRSYISLLNLLYARSYRQGCTSVTHHSFEGSVLFNNTLNTFIYGCMVKYHSNSERGNPLPPHGLLFPISSNGSFIFTG